MLQFDPAEIPPTRAGDPNKRIQATAVRALCGDTSDMWLWRRLHDPESGFPKPVYIGRRRFWREADVIDWLDAQATSHAAAE